jgi:hypothetical protein
MTLPQQQAPRDPVPPGGGGEGPRPRRRVITVERTTPLDVNVDRRVQAREAAELVAFRVGRYVRELAEDFRASDVYFKAKAAIIGAWAVMVVASIAIAMSGGPRDPAANDLHAYAQITRTSLGWGLLLKNAGRSPWTGMRLELGDGYTFEKPFVAADEELVLGSAQFLKDGRPPPPQMQPTGLRVVAEQGDAVIPLGSGP